MKWNELNLKGEPGSYRASVLAAKYNISINDARALKLGEDVLVTPESSNDTVNNKTEESSNGE